MFVIRQFYEYGIDGVFSTKEKAMERINNKEVFSDYFIEEYEVDTGVEKNCYHWNGEEM